MHGIAPTNPVNARQCPAEIILQTQSMCGIAPQKLFLQTLSMCGIASAKLHSYNPVDAALSGQAEYKSINTTRLIAESRARSKGRLWIKP